ncbi:MAG: hypothetical protein ACFE9L_08675 [Candidatus Hodarchaeota archaeon]
MMTTLIFRNETEVPPYPNSQGLQANGATLIFYRITLFLTPLKNVDFEDLEEYLQDTENNFDFVECKADGKDFSYESNIFRKPFLENEGKFIEIEYSGNSTIEPILLDEDKRIEGTVRYFFKIFRDCMLTTIVLPISDPNLFDINFLILKSNSDEVTYLSVKDILFLIEYYRQNRIKMGSSEFIKDTIITIEHNINSKLGFNNLNALDVEEELGIQLWHIKNLPDEFDKQINGKEISKRFAWEISAFLDASSDWVREHNLWKKREKSRIFSLLKEGFCILDDHMVFSNKNICFEFSYIDQKLSQPKNIYRLFSYGYDSSSLFLWEYAIIQEAFFQKYTSLINYELTHITEDDVIYGQFIERSVNIKRDFYKACDNIYWILDDLIEERHVEFLTYVMNTKGLEERHEEIIVKLDQLSQISNDMYNLVAQTKQADIERSSYILNLLLAATASIAIGEVFSRLVGFLYNLDILEELLVLIVVSIVSWLIIISFVFFFVKGLKY